LPDRVEVPLGTESAFPLRRIPLSEREASLYYYGFATRTLFPLCNLFVGRVEFDAEAWRAYKRVNQRFAEAVLEESTADDAIWIHDYHLALVPAYVRAARPEQRIAFSWHIPWPPVEALRALPWAKELVTSLLDADTIAFHLPRYSRHFAQAVEWATGRAHTTEGANASFVVGEGRRKVSAAAFQPGIDPVLWEARARAARGGRVVRLRRNLVAERLVLAVDRLDRSRGILERLTAVERFFDRFPSWRGRLVFCQVAVPSRTRVEDYRDLKRQVDAEVQRINDRFAQGAWLPIRYLYRQLDPDDLAVYYAAADVALTTPLADSLSLVALEYPAARMREDGTLIVSALAGASDALAEATQVNPYDPEGVASAVYDALNADPEEVRTRMRALRARVRELDVRRFLGDFWSAAFADRLAMPDLSRSPLPATVAQMATMSTAGRPLVAVAAAGPERTATEGDGARE
jgi:trehalose 6-phosphate synthase